MQQHQPQGQSPTAVCPATSVLRFPKLLWLSSSCDLGLLSTYFSNAGPEHSVNLASNAFLQLQHSGDFSVGGVTMGQDCSMPGALRPLMFESLGTQWLHRMVLAFCRSGEFPGFCKTFPIKVPWFCSPCPPLGWLPDFRYGAFEGSCLCCPVLVLSALEAWALDSYIAAVYKHSVLLSEDTEKPTSPEEALMLMDGNMDILEVAIKEAARQVLWPRDIALLNVHPWYGGEGNVLLCFCTLVPGCPHRCDSWRWHLWLGVHKVDGIPLSWRYSRPTGGLHSMCWSQKVLSLLCQG